VVLQSRTTKIPEEQLRLILSGWAGQCFGQEIGYANLTRSKRRSTDERFDCFVESEPEMIHLLETDLALPVERFVGRVPDGSLLAASCRTGTDFVYSPSH
jgi:hypothetical protein